MDSLITAIACPRPENQSLGEPAFAAYHLVSVPTELSECRENLIAHNFEVTVELAHNRQVDL
jgi:hypothetical protein